MNHALKVLQYEKQLLEKVLSEWKSVTMTEEKKIREKKLSDINKAISEVGQAIGIVQTKLSL